MKTKTGEELFLPPHTHFLLHLHQNKPSPCTSATFRLPDRNHEERLLLSFRLPSVLILHTRSSQGCQIESQLSQHEDEVAAPSAAHLFITGTHEQTDTPAVCTSATPGYTIRFSMLLTVPVYVVGASPSLPRHGRLHSNKNITIIIIFDGFGGNWMKLFYCVKWHLNLSPLFCCSPKNSSGLYLNNLITTKKKRQTKHCLSERK